MTVVTAMTGTAFAILAMFIGWFQLYYFHFYCQLSWLDVIQDDLKSALATMENFR